MKKMYKQPVVESVALTTEAVILSVSSGGGSNAPVKGSSEETIPGGASRSERMILP